MVTKAQICRVGLIAPQTFENYRRRGWLPKGKTVSGMGKTMFYPDGTESVVFWLHFLRSQKCPPRTIAGAVSSLATLRLMLRPMASLTEAEVQRVLVKAGRLVREPLNVGTGLTSGPVEAGL